MKEIDIEQKALDYQANRNDKHYFKNPNINDVGVAYMVGWVDAENTARKEINSVLAEVHKQIKHGLIINANVVYDMFEKLLMEL